MNISPGFSVDPQIKESASNLGMKRLVKGIAERERRIGEGVPDSKVKSMVSWCVILGGVYWYGSFELVRPY